jgi:hypothetical protein
MKIRPAVVFMAAALAGCGTAGSAEDFTWSIDAPKTVDKGSEFLFTVKATADAGAAEGVPYRYQILWPGSSTNPLRHKARTGQAQKVHARLAPGPATLVVTCENRAGLETKVLEMGFEVK